MTALIEKSDPQYFEVSSDGLYDRHQYKVVSKLGDALIVDSWGGAAYIWWNEKKLLSHIEVLDNERGFK
jgi:hypothetical protein